MDVQKNESVALEIFDKGANLFPQARLESILKMTAEKSETVKDQLELLVSIFCVCVGLEKDMKILISDLRMIQDAVVTINYLLNFSGHIEEGSRKNGELISQIVGCWGTHVDSFLSQKDLREQLLAVE